MHRLSLTLLGFSLALFACGRPPAAEATDPAPAPASAARTLEYDLRVHGADEAPSSGAPQHFAALLDARGVTTKITLPASDFADGEARVVLHGAAVRSPRVLLARTGRPDAALTRALADLGGEGGLRAQAAEGSPEEIAGTTPAGALRRLNPDTLLADLERLGFRRAGRDAEGRLRLERGFNVRGQAIHVTLAFDEGQKAVTGLLVEQTENGVVSRAKSDIAYRRVAGVAAPVPTRTALRLEVERTGAARLPVPPAPAARPLGPNEAPRLAPGEFVALTYTSPGNVADPNKSVLEKVVTYDNVRVNTLTPADFTEAR